MTPPSRLVLPAPRTRWSRRRFLQMMGGVGGAAVLGPGLLAACGGDDDAPSAASGDGGGSATLWFANWPAYIDEETVALFAEESGLDFEYTEEINSNAEYFAKIQPDLAAGRPIGPDIIAPTFWLAQRLIDLDFAEEIPWDDIPNASNLAADLANPDWDPEGLYTLPWQSGMTGIAYNIAQTGRELTSIEDLFDPAFKGQVGLLSEMRDTIGLMLLATGVNPEDATVDNAEEAFARIEAAKADGQIRQFTGNDYMDDLASGNFAACIGWSGDITQLALDNPDVRFAIPAEGGMRWSDVMMIPKGAENIANAATWMNYVYDPENAARIAEWVGYSSPVEGVREIFESSDDPAVAALATSELMFPSEDTLAELHVFASLSEEDEATFEERFSSIVGA